MPNMMNKDPAEGSREIVDRELKRQPKKLAQEQGEKSSKAKAKVASVNAKSQQSKKTH
jgi:hypothetical protein